jgi:hypothetical protein
MNGEIIKQTSLQMKQAFQINRKKQKPAGLMQQAFALN